MLVSWLFLSKLLKDGSFVVSKLLRDILLSILAVFNCIGSVIITQSEKNIKRLRRAMVFH